jgi:hypothetical protein
MTDLYEALRAAIAPDGRVRLTLPLLTAMREEAERRERGQSIEVLRERAETAERELEGAEREADEQRERRKRAELERDGAHQRAEKAERGLSDLVAHARACLDPEIVSRDPAHARLAALLERIEGR